MKNPHKAIGNRTRDLPACSAVPQPTAPPLATSASLSYYNLSKIKHISYYSVRASHTNSACTDSMLPYT